MKAHVYLLENDVIMWEEMPVASVFSVEKYGEKLRNLAKNLDSFYLILDLSKTKRPSAEVRSSLKELYSSFPNFEHAAAFTGANFMLNIAAKFVLNFVGLNSFSVHKTKDEAFSEIAEHKHKKSKVG
ncbi:MAG: hypothetical protein H7A32_02510 [Deltaproteobacteria bacterium]|nr:hypothetical protein [Deltaproteobacteria bacterium]